MRAGLNAADTFRVVAGLLLFLAGSAILMGIITAEVFYPPGYSTAQNEISDLGATRPPNSVIYQPSATIFNATMMVTGAMILVSTFFFQRSVGRWIVTIPLALLGVSVLGVGIFPGNNAVIHPIFALTAFLFGGLAAVASAFVVTSPARYAFGVFGAIILLALTAVDSLIPVLGDGGTERWIAYPVVLWLVGFGGYLLGMPHSPTPAYRP
ncbi:MAG: DUF998 domain-containing protein [Dehalococcoidales bacterium]|nr:DUF998 domain-containing protein [Dehalococcoidales bacterium]